MLNLKDIMEDLLIQRYMNNVYKDQYVLVLTQDGIRCAKVVSNPKRLRVSDLPFPPFLLQSIICVADESDLDYYN